MRLKTIATVLLMMVLTSACSSQESEKPRVEDPPLPRAEEEKKVLAADLDVPWDIIKREDFFYISERGGRIIKIMTGGKKEKIPLILKKEVSQQGEGGLLGFVLAPDFDSSKQAYIYHTYEENGQAYNRIVKIKLSGDGWVEKSVLLDHIPASIIHNGGRLEIGPDEKLYATTGDAGEEQNAQNLDSLSGKILRMNLDGTVPEDNPFPDSLVYSYGHRNPQGLAWTEEGDLYSAEHGSSAHDEMNRIQPGGNYGWPIIRGDETKKGMIPPLFQSGQQTWAPSGLAYNNGTLYMAGLRGAQIRAFHLQNHTSEIVFQGVGRLRDIVIENGAAYVITNNTDGRGNPRPQDDLLLKLELERIVERE
ncbi:MAG TPA: PQQ-dependent sugar dehydrogenase [Bacillales bacterium]|nr:PQQ-dependent sugar dehydrogenase [Bacillales bacterium]